MNKERPLNLVWTANWRDYTTHYEWTAPCGCAYHPEPQPHVHQCSAHKTTDTMESMQARIELLEKALNEIIDAGHIQRTPKIAKIALTALAALKT